MYVNFKLADSLGLTPDDVSTLLLINQNKLEDVSTFIENRDLTRVTSYIEYIKGKKGQDMYQRIRLNREGKDLVENIHTPEITVGDIDMFNYLSDMYLSHPDKERVIGNKKKTKMYCAIMRNHLNLTLHEFYWLCQDFLNNFSYTKKLENIFLDSNKNRYGSLQNNISDSPLYQYYDNNKFKIERIWEKKIKKEIE